MDSAATEAVVKTKESAKIIRNRYVFAALFAALMVVFGFVRLPVAGIGPPIVLRNFFVVLSGTVLGSFYGGAAVLIILAAGAIGFPVFALAGPALFLANPHAGYLIGFFLASLFAGSVLGLPKVGERQSAGRFDKALIARVFLASLAGYVIILMTGALFMMIYLSMSFRAAMLAGAAPFVIGDALKLAATVPLSLKLRPVAARYINPDA